MVVRARLAVPRMSPDGLANVFDPRRSTTYLWPNWLFFFFWSGESLELPVFTSTYFVSFFPVSQFFRVALKSCPLPVCFVLYPAISYSDLTIFSARFPLAALSLITARLLLRKILENPISIYVVYLTIYLKVLFHSVNAPMLTSPASGPSASCSAEQKFLEYPVHLVKFSRKVTCQMRYQPISGID